jgi:hypothetical protein
MIEAESISNDIIEWQSDGNELAELQNSFQHTSYIYYAGKYACKLLYNEYLLNLNNKIKNKSLREYYKKYKKDIKKAIANFA